MKALSTLVLSLALGLASVNLYALDEPQDYYSPAQNMQLAQQEYARGNFTEAVFALQRIMALEPGHIQATELLLQCYLALNELGAAQSLLERGQRALPAQVHRKWSQKLAAREDKARLSARKVLGVDLGFDDNLTSLTPSDSVYIPSSNQYLALDNHRREEGVFSRLYVGGSWRYNTQADRWWQLDTFAAKHWDDSYSQHQVFAALSFHRPLGKGRLGAQLDTVLDGGQDLDRRRSDALQLSYRQPQGSRVWQAKVRAVNTHFSGQSLRDDRRLSLDLDVEQALDERWQVKLGLSVSADIKDSPERADLDYRTTGISLALKRDLSEQWQLFIDADYQHTRYRGEDSSFQRKRRDSRTHLQLRLRYQYSERSSFSASIGHTRNQSNISLNQYRKNALRLGYLYQFE